jgi:hypothetical protein
MFPDFCLEEYVRTRIEARLAEAERERALASVRGPSLGTRARAALQAWRAGGLPPAESWEARGGEKGARPC